MKKWGLISLGLMTTLIWGVVLILVVTTLETDHEAYDHSFADKSNSQVKSLSNEQLTLHFSGQETGTNGEDTAETILGDQVLTKEWVEDVKEDGKLSIDTILESLDLTVALN
ncbi:hypothetical protein EQV77_00250 [Halobacillus fulvus]|nr:hypothetical protein EQV77_00250 [Halobacillus fulvus]